MTNMKHTSRPFAPAFTLVELIAVIVVLAILAAVAVPRYFNHADQARESATRGILGHVRSAINNFRLNATASQGTPRWPTMIELQTPGLVLEGSLPRNPYKSDAGNLLQEMSQGDDPPYTEDDEHWNYQPTSGRFWPNTNDRGEATW